MEKFILIVVFSLMTSVPVCADASSTSAHDLAEARLLAEWVGQADAQQTLGNLYYKGEGVQQDYAEALKWYRKAAAQGLAVSQNMLGVMYDRGEAVPQNFAEAVKWFRKAAEQGLVSAQFSLGKKYAEGKGVPQNFAEAYVWLSLSAASGYEEAFTDRDTYAGKLSHEELSSAQQRSAQLFEDIRQRKPR